MADLNYYLGPWQRDAEQNAWVAPSGTVGLLDFGSLNDCALSPSAIDQRGIGLFCTPRAITLPSEYDLLDSGDCREIQVTTAHRDLVEAILGVRIDAGGTLAEACSALFSAGDPTGLERWKPLTPTREGLYEIHLGGHSTVYARKFDGPADKTWNKLRDLLRYDLDQHDKECKAAAKSMKDAAKELRKQNKYKEAGACDARAAKIEQHAESVLDWMCIKHNCRPEDLSQTIRRGKARTTITENFTRADGDTIGNLLTWTEVAGDFDTASNRAQLQTSGDSAPSARAESALSSADHYAQCNCYGATGAAAQCGPAIRFSGSANTHYFAQSLFDYGSMFLSKMVAGSKSTLATPTASYSSGVLTKLDGSGSTLTMYYNGTGLSPTTDSSFTNLYTGIWGYWSGGGEKPSYANFEASDGMPEGPAGKPYYAYAQQQ